MPTPPVTVLDTIIGEEMQVFIDVKTTALALTPAQAAAITEAPGLIDDPVLGPGLPSLQALNLDWYQFFQGAFETTGMTKILTFQQALDHERAIGTVTRARLFGNVQDPVFFGINQVA